MQVITNNFLSDNRNRLAVLLMLLFLSSVKMFGQAKTTLISEENNVIVLNNNAMIVATDADIDFMNWFMGSKQAQSASASGSDASINTKKQLIISGGTTNRVLYKTLVKKVISIDNAIV